MLSDSINMLLVDKLPTAPTGQNAMIVFLGEQDGDFAPGLYSGLNDEWKLVGATTGGASIRTIQINTTDTPSIDVAEQVGDSLILSALVFRPGETNRTMLLVDKTNEETLETVQLSKAYTPVSIPQPYSSYRLDADPGLELTLKVL